MNTKVTLTEMTGIGSSLPLNDYGFEIIKDINSDGVRMVCKRCHKGSVYISTMELICKTPFELWLSKNYHVCADLQK